MDVAVIITSYNRKEKTLACIRRLFEYRHPEIRLTIFLTDDGSTDGTMDAVSELYPEVVISQGDGSLYYSRGTNLSWKRALEYGDFDGFLLHNDDTEILPNLWDEIMEADSFCRDKFGKAGIYAGPTMSRDGSHNTYGASRNISRWRKVFKLIPPNGQFQECEIANGNVTYISREIVDSLGIFYPEFVHGYGEYDYILTAHKKGIPVLLMRSYVGKCDNDHERLREILSKKNLKQRIQYLYSPTGFRFKDGMLFQSRHCPHYVPVMFLSYWAKALFPFIVRK